MQTTALPQLLTQSSLALPDTPAAVPAVTDVHKIKIVAQGRFGQVWMASMTGGEGTQYVAVKVFPAKDADSWVQEVEIYRCVAVRLC